jgi:ribokinase
LKPIVVVGSYNIGLTIKAKRIPATGETVLGSGYSEGHGGKGSNQAIAARRLGGKVRFVGCVGKDRYGDEAMSLWRAEGVETEAVIRGDTHTGLAFIVVGEAGVNAITVDPGANSLLNAGAVAAAKGALGGCGVLLAQLEIPSEAACAAASLFSKEGGTAILNPAPAVAASELDLSSFDILTPNETEFAVLTGTSDLQEGSKVLLGRGPEAVIVTLGEKGAQVTTKGDSYRVPAPVVKCVDPTGAGDAFNGALAVAISEGESVRSAVKFANYAGALAVTRDEVIPALPSRRELDEFMRNDVLE